MTPESPPSGARSLIRRTVRRDFDRPPERISRTPYACRSSPARDTTALPRMMVTSRLRSSAARPKLSFRAHRLAYRAIRNGCLARRAIASRGIPFVTIISDSAVTWQLQGRRRGGPSAPPSGQRACGNRSNHVVGRTLGALVRRDLGPESTAAARRTLASTLDSMRSRTARRRWDTPPTPPPHIRFPERGQPRGGMLWAFWKKFCGSYFVFTSISRDRFSA